MILSLLLLALLLGNAEFQSTNITEEALGRTQSFIVSTTKPAIMTRDNGTTSVDEDDKAQLEEALKNNQTSSHISEDDEEFQDQETYIPAQHCHQDLLVELSHSYCGESFHLAMETTISDWCILENIIRPYNDLTICLENLSPLVGCYFPNQHIQDFFLHIHTLYFKECSTEEFLLEDAPDSLVVALTLMAISFIPALLYPLLQKK